MVPTTYTELFIFLIGAVGAALLLGTGAALLRFRRTGAFPGEEPGAHVERAQVRGAAVKCVLGAVIIAGALVTLAAVRA